MFIDALYDLQEPPLAAVPTATPSRSPRTTLPRIQLPQFSGRYEDWPPFRDLFNSLIGKDAATSPVEKLHYLKASVKGDADLLIRNLPTTSENYGRAWQALTDFYENKRLLVRSYLHQFMALTKLKSESASELRKLYHCVLNTVSSLEGIERPITSGEDLFVHLVVELLDARSRREWEASMSDTTEPPSYDDLQIFLERRLHTLESLQPVRPEPAKAEVTSSKTTRALHARKRDNKGGRCSLCGKEHYILWCDVYQKKTADERKRHVEANHLCLNCLGRHKLSDCRSKRTCSTCIAQHHTSLHEAFQTSVASTTSHLAQHPPALPVAVLLATARVRVLDRCGAVHTARALVDQGSESSLVSESLAQRLRLPRSSTSIAIFGVGGKQTGTARGLISMQISPLTGGAPMTVPALVFLQLTLYDSGIRADPKSWTHLAALELADLDYLAADPIDILLGADVYAYILQPGLQKGGPNEPVAQQTSLGWILSGAVSSANSSRRALTLHCRVEEDLATLVEKFWQQDELADRSSPLTPADQECEDQFRQTHRRAADGRYVVRLPVKPPLPDLSRTRHTARRVLTNMERRFSQDARLRRLYVDFLRQYEDMGHMTPLNGSKGAGGPVSYLPHHGVLRESSTTTKLRVVFNGSTATSSGDSLNRHLLVGPNLLPPLADVLLRWRVHRFVLATDIEKMYRQIMVHPEDRDLQRIVWRYNPQDELREYRLNTVTYGLACAPFLAMRVLRQLADDEETRYPLAAAVIRRDVYMDDVLTGADSLTDARELLHQLVNLCVAGGFPL
ncbi:PREDICTED: uncharacterized protein LOC105563753, partial [Vollenhovia emeryi]|uniref:uncharacterized protein LOC105563753 n=1 Tax=Vollenhovia emeryi TaxID=411798 RepID=UPI0005F51713